MVFAWKLHTLRASFLLILLTCISGETEKRQQSGKLLRHEKVRRQYMRKLWEIC